MKWVKSIGILVFALCLLLKDLGVLISIAQDMDYCYIDITEESSEKGEKKDLEEKEDPGKLKFALQQRLFFVDETYALSIRISKKNKYPVPYFEISSPPPELA